MSRVALWLLRAFPRVLVWAGIGAVFLVHARQYLPFFLDDAFISLRYSQRLLEGHGLTWTEGPRVEGYTNFLWVIAVAAVGAFRPNGLIDAARTVGVVSALLTLAAMVWSHRGARWRDLVPGAMAACALAVAGPFAAWSVGGLEQPLLLATVSWGVVTALPLLEADRPSLRHAWPAGLCFSLTVLTRPDGVLLPAAACAALAFLRVAHLRRPPGDAAGSRLTARVWRECVRPALWLGVLPLATLALHVAFRRVYYGEWVPNTYHAKVAFNAGRVLAGVNYVKSAEPFLPLVFAWLPALAGAALDAGRRRRVAFLFLLLFVWLAYVVVIGGDMMPQRRHLLLGLLLGVLVAVEGLGWLLERRAWGPVVAVIASVGLMLALWARQRGDPERARALRDVWHWPGRPIGHFFRAAFGDRDPLLAVDAAGALPYFARLRTLDMLGLNDAWLAKHPPADMGRGPLAHELGDGGYLWRSKPDIIVFHIPAGLERAQWRGGRELQALPDFARLYQLMSYETPEPDRVPGRAWVRREDSAIGIQRTDREIVIPGYLFNANRETRVRLDADGWAGVDVTRTVPARIDGVAVPPGSWFVRARGRGRVDLSLSEHPGTLPLVRGGEEVVASVPPHVGKLSLICELAAGESARIRDVTLTRRESSP